MTALTVPQRSPRGIRPSRGAASTSASVTSTIRSRSSTAICSSGVWMSVIPLARLTHGRPAPLKTFASAAPPESPSRGCSPCPLERLDREPHGEVVVAEAGIRGTSARSRSRACSPRRSRRTPRRRRSAGRPRSTRPWSCERTSASSEHRSGTMFRAVPPRIRPTFAVVSSSMPPERHVGDRARGRRRSRAPLLGIHPRVRGAPDEREPELLRRRRADDDLADRRRLVVDVAHPRVEPVGVERVGADAGRSPPSA